MESPFKTVGIAGLGLIGGSMGLALRRGGIQVLGFERAPEIAARAVNCGAADRTDGELRACSLVLLALYPGAAVEFVRSRLDDFMPGTLIADLCGIKRHVCRKLEPLCKEHGLLFLGAHPMAGRETSGIDSAREDLFQGASLVLTPGEGFPQQLLEQFCNFMKEYAGFGNTVCTSPEHHDRMIAYTSQLAHILSSAYIQNPLCERYSGFTGGSFQDLTRVARLNSRMWGELFLKNRDMLCEQLDILIENLFLYRQALSLEDEEKLQALMENGTRIKEELLHRAQAQQLSGE
ncbi:MAG: prephenate dehydrogenase/arogenate dehydrogenase family protein [Provencibacterium sp.]|jgi:prephenate dehydrogenase|nr:prephenate dehydrogenase/arogenate dehydrogenase family protein [Provencibacterium sp.]